MTREMIIERVNNKYHYQINAFLIEQNIKITKALKRNSHTHTHTIGI